MPQRTRVIRGIFENRWVNFSRNRSRKPTSADKPRPERLPLSDKESPDSGTGRHLPCR